MIQCIQAYMYNDITNSIRQQSLFKFFNKNIPKYKNIKDTTNKPMSIT